ncbi:MAG: phosphonate ABC transporter, permease protein PhnE [Bradyrhizobium sp.]|uniref:phosphonate ABC transporter, permease protein PhnE n=1 Tax=Bradyrhizobium sp. TaxID=376 RepID=UPI0025BF370D|nr:phosphonate ABC transporter, permease protein PhnE [Bradyrhizobium sp.]MBI5260417.1 phosphonate ABC transporter, permease protein PhnE [Bradyrhizobium sp.]
MNSPVYRLSDQQIAVLLGHYSAAVAAKRRRALLFALAVALCATLAVWGGEVDLRKFVEGLPRLWSYFHDIMPKLRLTHFSADFAEWFWNWDVWLSLLAETLLVAYVGTFLGATIGFALCFLASANLVKNAFARACVRRSLEFCRTVPDIVFALLFVYALGLGPVPGVVAIAIHTTGALGKQLAEVVENIDMKQVEGVRSTGATWVEQIRFAVVPQVLSNFVSYTLMRFEINVRGASVMGFVGAGGIGQELLSSIRQFYYSDVSAILLMIIVTVSVIDLLTERLRHRLLGIEGRQ